ncbi:NAD(P)/FAD-dependent oxidoreductase [Acidocella sp.]|uniref:NAD(P)/FAD-dependent oxidoreductase n=1 Tax=Acidocella sp. TaxID=50710 RepID=UPI002601C52B|nr:FAD-dependent oxidoreductase [Acidocella sp.]
MGQHVERQRIAVVGAGITGLSCAWLLSQRHEVTLFEALPRLGGHSHTVDVEGVAVDTGFIVYNEPAYPNLSALFAHLGVETDATDMSFSVSLRNGGLEYAGSNLRGLFAQPANALRRRFWAMLYGLLRFYHAAPRDAARVRDVSLGEYLRQGGYGEAFLHDHLYPMIAAVWSCPAGKAQDLPAEAFIRFCENHGLLKLTGRPLWRTVRGGSRAYVERLRAAFAGTVRHEAVMELHRLTNAVALRTAQGTENFDQAVLACHADEALALLAAPTEAERTIMGAFRTTSNEVILHGDAAAMPRRRAAWAAWNYAGGEDSVAVTYWMNRLQNLPGERNWFVTLNPVYPLRDAVMRQVFTHPVFDLPALRAQARLWEVQGINRTWFCGAWWGAGFHEDGLQAGLAVAEAIGDVRRPWRVANLSGRIPARPVP